MKIERSDIVAYAVGEEIHCTECISKEDLRDVKGEDVITHKGLEDLEQEHDVFCDGDCGQRLTSWPTAIERMADELREERS